jgi:hypothetical protein
MTTATTKNAKTAKIAPGGGPKNNVVSALLGGLCEPCVLRRADAVR